MLFIRLAGVITGIVIAAGIVAFLVSRDRRFLAISWRVTKYAAILVLAILALFLLERVVVLI